MAVRLSVAKATITEVSSESDTEAVAADFVTRLLASSASPRVVYLRGDLGAGKSVFARRVLRVLGVREAIKSPTYTLVEQYRVTPSASGIASAAHLDLYRLVDPEELYFIGFDDVLHHADLILIEWPEKAAGELPMPTHEVMIEYLDSASACARRISVTENFPM